MVARSASERKRSRRKGPTHQRWETAPAPASPPLPAAPRAPTAASPPLAAARPPEHSPWPQGSRRPPRRQPRCNTGGNTCSAWQIGGSSALLTATHCLREHTRSCCVAGECGHRALEAAANQARCPTWAPARGSGSCCAAAWGAARWTGRRGPGCGPGQESAGRVGRPASQLGADGCGRQSWLEGEVSSEPLGHMRQKAHDRQGRQQAGVEGALSHGLFPSPTPASRPPALSPGTAAGPASRPRIRCHSPLREGRVTLSKKAGELPIRASTAVQARSTLRDSWLPAHPWLSSNRCVGGKST